MLWSPSIYQDWQIDRIDCENKKKPRLSKKDRLSLYISLFQRGGWRDAKIQLSSNIGSVEEVVKVANAAEKCKRNRNNAKRIFPGLIWNWWHYEINFWLLQLILYIIFSFYSLLLNRYLTLWKEENYDIYDWLLATKNLL